MTLTDNQIKTLGKKAQETFGTKTEHETYLALLESHAHRRNWILGKIAKENRSKAKKTTKKQPKKQAGKKPASASGFSKEQNQELERIKKEVGL